MKDKELKTLGEEIRALRKDKKLTQAGLAEIAGIHHTYLSHIERGTQRASLNMLFRLATALGVTLRITLSKKGRS